MKGIKSTYRPKQNLRGLLVDDEKEVDGISSLMPQLEKAIAAINSAADKLIDRLAPVLLPPLKGEMVEATEKATTNVSPLRDQLETLLRLLEGSASRLDGIVDQLDL